jgi:hypothetical protein
LMEHPLSHCDTLPMFWYPYAPSSMFCIDFGRELSKLLQAIINMQNTRRRSQRFAHVFTLSLNWLLVQLDQRCRQPVRNTRVMTILKPGSNIFVGIYVVCKMVDVNIEPFAPSSKSPHTRGSSGPASVTEATSGEIVRVLKHICNPSHFFLESSHTPFSTQ